MTMQPWNPAPWWIHGTDVPYMTVSGVGEVVL